MNESLIDSILRDVDDDAEQETLRQTWNRLEEVAPAEPPPDLARRFARSIELSRIVLPRRPSLSRRLLPLAAVLIVGIAIGGLALRLPFGSRDDRARAQSSRVESDRLRRAVSFAFEQRPLASRRLEAVETLARLELDPEIGRILTEVVSSDPSVDVRLVAIGAVEPYVTDNEVARRLIQTVRQTDSTLVRIRLIELFVDHRIAVALPEIESLHRDPRQEELVRETAQWATGRL